MTSTTAPTQSGLIQAEVPIGRVGDLPPGERRRIRVEGRNIAVYHVPQRGYFAVDDACYHHGAPLLDGDIEDLGGHPCVKCPWHSYQIALDTGEGFYWGLTPNPATGKMDRQLKSKGPKQRTHRVEQRGDMLVCIVDTTHDKWESDTYACMPIANPVGGGGGGYGYGGGYGAGQVKIHSSAGSAFGVVDSRRSGAVLAGVGGSAGGIGFGGGVGGFAVPSGPTGAGLPSGAVLPMAAPAAPPADCTFSTDAIPLRCVSSAVAATGVRTFAFAPACPTPGGPRGLRVQPQLGAWVRVRVHTPGGLLERQWTVTGLADAHQGSWFSLTIKRPATTAALAGGKASASTWLHEHDAATLRVELVECAGPLAAPALAAALLAYDPRATAAPTIVFVTGGIGITPLLAFVRFLSGASAAARDLGFRGLRLVHLHADRSVGCVAGLDLLRRAQRGALPGVDYHLTLFLSGGGEAPAGVRMQPRHMTAADVNELAHGAAAVCLCAPVPLMEMARAAAVATAPTAAIFEEEF
jgi:nitrite reductase/ring-hydroxylating ferredoxin subunit/ferredoxin-NADP reductase